MPTRVINAQTAQLAYLVGLGDRGELVSIMRPSKWGNPYSHLRGSRARWPATSREDAIAQYEAWLIQQPELMRALVPELRGKVLSCCCLPLACHGLILARYADEYPVITRRIDGGISTIITFDEAGRCSGGGVAVRYKR